MNYREQEVIEIVNFHARPQSDKPEDQLFKAHQHAKAHDLYKEYMANRAYLSAYAIAFSLLEDRLRAMAIVKERDLLKGENFHVYITQGIARVITFAYDRTPENLILIKNLKNTAINRNKFMHEAMWRTDAIKEIDVKHVMNLQGIVKNDLDKMKRKLKKESN